MTSVTFTIVSVGFLSLLAYIVYQMVRYVSSENKIRAALFQWPGLPPHWLSGNFHQHPMSNPKVRDNTPDDVLVFWRKMSAQFPRGYRWLVGPISGTLVANHPDLMKAVMKGRDPKPLGPGIPNYRFALPWLGYGLLIAGGETWLRNRRLLTNAFHFDVLKPYMDVYNKATDILLSKMSACVSRGESFEVTKDISLCTLDILLNCAFTYESDCQIKGDNHPYVTAVTELGLCVRERFFSPPLYFDVIYKNSNTGKKFYKNCDFVHGISDGVIQARRAKLEEKRKSDAVSTDRKYLDFLDILLSAQTEDGEGMTDLEIRNEVDTFLFEGHDTTASGLTWMLYQMATHPEHQKRVQEEIDAVMKDRDSDEIIWEDLGKLTYLVQCLKETMRICPPVPLVKRLLEKDITIDGKILPAGTAVDLLIYGLHHNPEIWPDSMEFIPDRFSPENVKKMDPFAYVPFSAGPRNCIGQNFALNEEKVILARIMRKFHIELDPSLKVVTSVQLVMKTKDGFKLKLKPRF